MSDFLAVANEALAEIRLRSQKDLYKNDYHAWRHDILGYRSYAKMNEITWETLHGKLNKTAVASANGTTKDLALTTPILTTTGWKTMETVEVGDYVYSEEGEPILVSWKSEVFNRPSFEVKFDDGAKLVTSDSHEWNTISLKDRGKSSVTDWRDHWDLSQTRSTGEILETLRNRSGSTNNHLVPLARPLNIPKKDLPVDPYVLGAWLGDGTSVRAEITCNYAVDGYVIDRINEHYPMRKLPGADYAFVADISDAPTEPTNQRGPRGSRFYNDLKTLGVLGDKHIPEEYLYGSIEQRIELLRGLMDTDGYSETRTGMCGWGQTSERLAGQFGDLLASLGVRFALHPTISASGKTAYVFRFRPTFDPFTPGERKSRTFTNSSPAQASRLTGRVVVSVTPVESVPTQCIQVESERHLYLAGAYLVPTHNSWEMSCMIAWASSVFSPGEVRSIVTAPSLPQVEQVIWAYLKNHFGEATARGNALPGRLTEKAEWVYDGDNGKVFLATARVPAKGKEMAVFQGVRGVKGRVFVFSDEGGAINRDMFTAMEAVVTGSDSRITIYGNPDYPQAYWRRFWDKQKPEGRTWNTFNISGFDLPTMTGEVVYPDDPEMNARFLRAITSKEWIENKVQIWQPNEARYLSKVMGQFPGDDDSSFFPQVVMDQAYDTVIEENEDAPLVLGVDIARYGQDSSVIASNRGGRIRVEESWGKTPLDETARRIHRFAQDHRAVEVRIDQVGVGGGVFDILNGELEYDNKCYTLLGWDNGYAAPDPKQWSNLRAYSYDNLRQSMTSGEVDLDYLDEELRDELQSTTYRFAKGGDGAIQITPKDELKKGLGGRSPDRLDAVVMAACDMSPWTGNPLNALKPGSVVAQDPSEMDFPDPHWNAIEF